MAPTSAISESMTTVQHVSTTETFAVDERRTNPRNTVGTRLYELALKLKRSGASAPVDKNQRCGFIHSFNGPHSLFVIRSARCAPGHQPQLGHVLMDEGDSQVSLLERLHQHAIATATIPSLREGRGTYDVPAPWRTRRFFNIRDGNFRCPNSQQGYSPFSTWTRGLRGPCVDQRALEFLRAVGDKSVTPLLFKAARYLRLLYDHASAARWDALLGYGAPLFSISAIGRRIRRSINEYEPVDSSAAAIAAPRSARLGRTGCKRNRIAKPLTYWIQFWSRPY